MQNLRKPQWLFMINTGPLVVLFAMCYGIYTVIHSLLPPESVVLWQRFGAGLGLLGLGTAGFAAVQLRREQLLGAVYSLVQIGVCSGLLALVVFQSDSTIPRSVPPWMVPTDPGLIAWTLLMPTLAHAVLVLVARFTPEGEGRVLPSLLLALGVPLGWWMVGGLLGLLPWDYLFPHIAEALLLLAAVMSTISFFFFLIRTAYILAQKKGGFWAGSGWVFRVLVALVMPLLGLAVNSGVLLNDVLGNIGGGIFGDFSSPWFYILAALNGVLLCLPDSPRPALRLVQLLGRAGLFGFTLYFAVVFLPFLPLSIPAILVFGVGFLILTPVLLFVVHVRQLGDDLAALQPHYGRRLVLAVLVGGLTVLPLYLTASYWHDRRTLHEALDYVYSPNYAQATRLDANALQTTLGTIRQHKERRRGMDFGRHQPYLSTYFNWLVLDNLMLSESKLADLQVIFNGQSRPDYQPAPPPTQQPADAPQLRTLTATSSYDARQQSWVSWVDLTVANPQAGFGDWEYTTKFQLPAGCWVSDYYLTIGQRQERGILAEKKAAAWVYAQILNERASRDPGLLSYDNTREVSLRVYPVIGAEPRHTRIQLLHKEPFELSVDGQKLTLGNASAPPVAAPVTTPDSSVLYLSATAKSRLPLVQRRPYYHFLLDASTQRGLPTAYAARINNQLTQKLPNGVAPRYSLVNAYTTTLPAGADWRAELAREPAHGGFFLTGAIQRVLFEAQQHPGPTYPVIVVVSEHFTGAVLADNFESFQSAYPESDVFYELNPEQQLLAHSLRAHSAVPLADAPRPGPAPVVRAWPTAAQPRAYLADNQQAELVLSHPQASLQPAATASSRWLTGLLLSGYSQWQTFHPESTDRQRLPFLQASFRAGILTPFTSFLALENDAQKAALRRKQEETLAANANLDVMEEDDLPPVETPIDGGVGLLLLAGVGLAGWALRRR
ncbi:MSEP-CTERM sorting domain-containing protein [Hymenobacter sp. ASUV-10]|uniref:MSEP-CTERM sorting domain-containing protein n=1 Tax=Hymenobacter aranciens TaxID=3063996 RepID=A0ABT9BDR9_9BACT|nr:MSEP-CTERM sorting domain-containing protein [Hymenobacter sp. ASUV-10]MDO7875844.1 MSEP-CTERM sorting domain-containing protein [Hymenobacter sp. ASUV-10]